VLSKLLTFGLLLSCCASIAQNKVSFTIQNEEQQGLSQAVLYLDQKEYQSDATGRIQLDLKKAGIYQAIIFVEGYKIQQKLVVLSNGSNHLFTLAKEYTVLEDINIAKIVEESQVNRGIIRAVVVDTKSQVIRPASLSDLMNRTTGVRVRESGGLGAETSVNLNGFQGQAIRYFKDGIPLNYLGRGYNLSTIPLDVLDRVEVYKGIVPVHLASDALGGAINLISNATQANTLRTSLEYGSFSTFRGALSGHYNLNNQFYIGGTFFYNTSDNDYKINTPDPELAKSAKKVRLFHNQYKHYYTQVYLGAKNLKWADLLQVDLNYYNVDKQIQNSPTSMVIPYGGISDKEHSIIPTLRYKKAFLNSKLTVDQFVAYNVVKTRAIDTLQARYDWLGNYATRGYRGEGDHPMDASIDMTFLTSRTLVGFALNPTHQLWLNNTYNYTKRVGIDWYGKKLEDTQQPLIEIPSYYKKNTTALGLTSQWFSSTFETHILLKKWRAI